jgi:hypothetical protein
MNRKILRDAEKIHELWNNLEIISIDDRLEIEQLSDSLIINEAKYVLGCFHESGHALNESLTSSDKETRLFSKLQIKQLQKFLAKYSTNLVDRIVDNLNLNC